MKLSLDQIRTEGTSFTHQESATMQLTASTAFQAVSWLNLWSTVGKISAAMPSNSEESATFLRLLLSGGETISYLVHLTANVWANWILKRRDAALSKISKFVGPDSTLALRNGTVLVLHVPM